MLEAGNKGIDSADSSLVSGMDSLSLLTTSRDPLVHPLTLSWATSAATAQLSGMATALLADDRSLWPETVRAADPQRPLDAADGDGVACDGPEGRTPADAASFRVRCSLSRSGLALSLKFPCAGSPAGNSAISPNQGGTSSIRRISSHFPGPETRFLIWVSMRCAYGCRSPTSSNPIPARMLRCRRRDTGPQGFASICRRKASRPV
ncbi:S8 family serine peptidase [Novosphingobium panipatense]